MTSFFSRGLGLAGGITVVAAACGGPRTNLPPQGESATRSTMQALFVTGQRYRGQNLNDDELILTFDDGPSGNETADGHYQTREISTYLRSLGIRTTFFIIGNCVETPSDDNLRKDISHGCSHPSENARATIEAVLADGHAIGNHTTTHRPQSGLTFADSDDDIAYTDNILASYVTGNRFFFRTPTGAWNDAYSTTDYFNAANEPMRKYVGPIYWNIGGGPTTYGANTSMATDWECWGGRNNSGHNKLSTTQCAIRYLNEIHTKKKGIVLMHDQAYGNADAATDDVVPGNTLRMIKRVLPQLITEGFTFKTLAEDPDLAHVLSICDPSCETCGGPAANDCLSCPIGTLIVGGSCEACTACKDNSFTKTVCVGAADTVCQACSECAAGRVLTACSATADTVCAESSPPFDAGAGTCTGSRAAPISTGDSGSSGCAESPSPVGSAFSTLALAATAVVGARRRRRQRPPRR